MDDLAQLYLDFYRRDYRRCNNIRTLAIGQHFFQTPNEYSSELMQDAERQHSTASIAFLLCVGFFRGVVAIMG
jgi:hypothetical protein